MQPKQRRVIYDHSSSYARISCTFRVGCDICIGWFMKAYYHNLVQIPTKLFRGGSSIVCTAICVRIFSSYRRLTLISLLRICRESRPAPSSSKCHQILTPESRYAGRFSFSQFGTESLDQPARRSEYRQTDCSAILCVSIPICLQRTPILKFLQTTFIFIGHFSCSII